MPSLAAGAIIEHDEHGDLLIRIPKRLAERADENAIAAALERVLRPLEFRGSDEADWENDPIAGLVGLFESDVTDGSVNHDKHIYLDPPL